MNFRTERLRVGWQSPSLQRSLGLILLFVLSIDVNGLVALFIPGKRARARSIIAKTGTQLRHWIFGQIVCMIAVGGMIGLGLYLSGIPVPIVL